MWFTRTPRALAIVSYACLPLVLTACASGLNGGKANCGNGIVEQGEDCDDGNDKGGDGCDPSCRQEFGYGCEGEPSRCAPVCGDGFRLSVEVCDGSDLNGATCESLELGSGVLSCAANTCTLDTSGCAGAPCGNGTLDAGEECDGANVGGEDCASRGYDGGTLACSSDCTFDTSGCELLSCGNGVVEGIERCDDQNTTPGDGCGANCLVETGWQCTGQPSVCTRLCGNGVIDAAEDCDGAALGGQSCTTLGLGYVGGTLACALNCTFNTAACELPSCGNGTLDAPEQCDGVLLGGQTCASVGPYVGGTLLCLQSCAYDLSGCIPITCGDGIISAGETCDDGNTGSGDGCNILCHIESGWTCSGEPSTCQHTCGNTVWDLGEECDGADLHGGSCITEGFTGGTLACTTTCVYDTSGCTSPVCGNSTVEAGEQCDDGNTTSGDGCSDTCQLESTCPTPLSLGTWASGDDGWTRDTSYWVRAGGYMHLDYTPGHSGSYTKPLTYATNVDLSACSSATLTFAARLSDDPGDYGSDRSEKVLVQCSGDAGAGWTTLTPNPWPANQQSNCSSTGGYCAGGSGHDWSFSQTSQTITIPAGCLTTQARFQFLATGSTTWSLNAPGWYVYPVTLN